MERVVRMLGDLSVAALKHLKALIELQRLKLVMKMSELFSTFITSVLVFMMGSLSFLSLNLAAAIWLGAFLGASHLGFLILAVGYLLLLVVFLVFFKGVFKRGMRNIFIRISLSED
jgi:hypothetical protein